ncbi:hypothetical protein A3746_20535 [Oleibacter sp. HI0075]|nr:hypothetical protein A3746_11875 [Oleibacter sp. HI0075]KZY98106.1 hypothetical protein A3746_20535 [Oleibacter sp. HI0075]
MNALRLIPVLLITLLFTLAGCAPLDYQAVQLDSPEQPAQTDGYINKEVSEGVHVIEVRHESLPAMMLAKERTLSNLKDIWHRRASELCKKGYQGEPEIIRPDEARTDEFYCTLNVCQKYLLASGVAYCKATYEL